MYSIPKELRQSLNLTDQQAAVYVAALELGEANMQELARKSGVKRTSMYNFVEEMKTRGFITETTKGKRKMYSGVDPHQLIELEKARLHELQRTLPELLAIQNKSRTKPRVTYYEGIDKVQTVYDKELEVGKPVIGYEDMDAMLGAMTRQFATNWPAERARKNISYQTITRDSNTARQFTKKNNTRLLRETKFVTSDQPWNTEINIFGDHVALFRFRKNHALAVLIEDQDIANTLRSVWQRLWDELDQTPIT